LIQTRSHVRNAIASRERQVVMRKVKSTITASQRWNTEITRPAFPYDKAMAERAFAMHFDITPDSSPSSLNEENFLEKNQMLQSPPT